MSPFNSIENARSTWQMAIHLRKRISSPVGILGSTLQKIKGVLRLQLCVARVVVAVNFLPGSIRACRSLSAVVSNHFQLLCYVRTYFIDHSQYKEY